MRTVALSDPDKFGDNPPAGLGLREGKVDGLFFLRNLDALDLLKLLNTALHLLGLGCLVAKPVDEDLELLDSLALVLVRGFELLATLSLGSQVLVVVSRIKMNSLVPDLERLSHRDVEKVAVVRNQHKRERDSS